MLRVAFRGLGLSLVLASSLAAQGRGPALQLELQPQTDLVYEQDGLVVAADASGTYVYGSWGEYFQSPFAQQNGKAVPKRRSNTPLQIVGMGYIRAKFIGGGQQVLEFDLLVAGDAWYRRLTGQVAIGE